MRLLPLAWGRGREKAVLKGSLDVVQSQSISVSHFSICKIGPGSPFLEYHLHLLCRLEKIGSLQSPLLRNYYISQECKSLKKKKKSVGFNVNACLQPHTQVYSSWALKDWPGEHICFNFNTRSCKLPSFLYS